MSMAKSPHSDIGAFVPHNLKTPLPGNPRGPLAGLTAAVKDMYDIAGERTGGGNPDWLAAQQPATKHAAAVSRLLNAGVTIVGKTVCDEFFYSVTGANAHYGTPQNPGAPGRLPGGSSSGSAAATAAGLCDIGLGSDTGGSVRVPAAFCGIYGIRPTLGRVDLTGAMAMAPSFDVAGWFADDPAVFRRVGPVLLEGQRIEAPITQLLVAADAFAQADEDVASATQDALDRTAMLLPEPRRTTVAADGLDRWREAFRMIQAREVWSIYGDFITRHRPSLGPGVRERMAFAATVSESDVAPAREIQEEARAQLHELLSPGVIMALPTAPCVPPPVDLSAEAMENFRIRVMRLTCIAVLSGLPQVTLPVATVGGLPIALSFIGWQGGDEALLDLAFSLANIRAQR
jgi:amidase